MQGGEVNRIALRVPPFWKPNIQLWFSQVEAAFQLSGITNDDTKYASLVSSIDSESLNYVSDLIYSPPQQDKYDTLKRRLLTEFADSDGKRLKKLLNELQLGDSKPSTLLRQMRDLAAGKLNEDFLQNLWLQRLPTNIQSILLASNENLPQLAVLADKVHEITADSAHVYSIANTEAVAAIAQPSILDLQKQIEKLTLHVEKLSQERSRSHSRGRSFTSRSQSRNGSRTPAYANSENFCFYHNRFGRFARQCRQPCSFYQSGNE